MTESILSKKSRILGDKPDNRTVLNAIRSKQWTASDAREYRKAVQGVKKNSGPSYAERVAGTVRRNPV